MNYKITIEQEDRTEEDKYDRYTEIYQQILVLDNSEKLSKVIRYLNGDTLETEVPYPVIKETYNG